MNKFNVKSIPTAAWVVSLIVSSSLGAGLVQAQEVSALTLEEVTVTARKQEENLQNVPVAVSNFSGDDLRLKSITKLDDLEYSTPSLTVEPGNANPTEAVVSLRGQVQIDALISLDPSVGIYYDNVYVGRSTGSLLEFFDIERVEVLKGPQGTLYGRNTTGGAIKVITNKANTDEFSGFGTVEFGNFGARTYEGAINIPLVDETLALRVAASKRERDGFTNINIVDPISNILPLVLGAPNGSSFTPTDANVIERVEGDSKDDQTVRANLLWNVNDKLSVTLYGDRSESQGIGRLANNSVGGDLATITFLDVTGDGIADAPFVSNLVPSSGDFYEGLANLVPEFDVTTSGVGLDVAYEGELFTTKFTYSHRDLESATLVDIDGTSFGIITSGQSLDSDQDSFELQIESNASDSRFNWLAGIYSFEESGLDFTDIAFFGGAALGGANIVTNADAENESQSIYFNTNYALTEQLGLIAGARYTEDTKGSIGRNTLNGFCSYIPGTPGLVINADGSCVLTREDDFDHISWTVGLDYQINDTLIYAKASSGVRSGGQNLRGFGISPADGTDTSAAFDEETATDIEIGIKTSFWDGRGRLNGTYYHTFLDDSQQTFIIPGPGGTVATSTLNASDADVDGLEVELTALLSEGLTLSFTGSYTDFEYDDPQFIPVKTPEIKANIGITYETELSGLGSWVTSANYSWQDDYNGQALAVFEDSTIFDSYSLINLRTQLELESLGISVALWAKNLTDEEYDSTTSGIAPFPFISPAFVGISPRLTGEPRTFGINITKNF